MTSSTGIDITSYLNVEGSVDYGTNGTYELHYSLEYEGDIYTKTRYVQVQNGTYVAPTTTKNRSQVSGFIVYGALKSCAFRAT